MNVFCATHLKMRPCYKFSQLSKGLIKVPCMHVSEYWSVLDHHFIVNSYVWEADKSSALWNLWRGDIWSSEVNSYNNSAPLQQGSLILLTVWFLFRLPHHSLFCTFFFLFKRMCWMKTWWETFVLVRTLCSVANVMRLACGDCLDNCRYMVFTNKLSSVVDLLVHEMKVSSL